MREQLIHYVDLLFAGAPDAGDIKQEILQNTLDRYDDLLEQGKTPQAAYSLAIAGIGDINELLTHYETAAEAASLTPAVADIAADRKPAWKTAARALGICLYILCPTPLFVLQNELGLCGLLVFVAAATALMILSGGKSNNADTAKADQPLTPQEELRKAVKSIISVIGLCCYLAISFMSGAWYITWLIFPIMGAVQQLVKACMDLKEANRNET